MPSAADRARAASYIRSDIRPPFGICTLRNFRGPSVEEHCRLALDKLEMLGAICRYEKLIREVKLIGLHRMYAEGNCHGGAGRQRDRGPLRRVTDRGTLPLFATRRRCEPPTLIFCSSPRRSPNRPPQPNGGSCCSPSVATPVSPSPTRKQVRRPAGWNSWPSSVASSARPAVACHVTYRQPLCSAWHSPRAVAVARASLAVGAVRSARTDPRFGPLAASGPGAGVPLRGMLRMAQRWTAIGGRIRGNWGGCANRCLRRAKRCGSCRARGRARGNR